MLSKASKVSGVICVLSGGVGAARLLRALSGEVAPSTLTAIVNVGDDLVLHGLTICPDLDTITYTLAGLNNETLGWGLEGETWRVMAELRELGGEAWFGLGDRDLATHLYRSQRLSEGATKAEVTRELCARWGVAVQLLPVSNEPVTTSFTTEIGPLSFQEYFVKHHHGVKVDEIHVSGADASPAPGVLEALRDSSRIVLAPSNPLISLAPLLRVRGVAAAVAQRRDDVIAVSPIVAGAAIKGPADRLLQEFGYDVSCVGVAQYVLDTFGDMVGTWIIDEADADHVPALEALGVAVRVTTTMMNEPLRAQALAREVLA